MSSLSIQKLFNVEGLVAVVTGGGTGIGSMMAKALATNGAHKVYIVGRREEPLKEIASTVDTNNIIPLTADVTSKESLEQAVKKVADEVGYVNVVIANSGVDGAVHKFSETSSVEEIQKAMWEPDFDEYMRPFGTNVGSVWYTAAAFLGLLDKGNKKGNLEQGSQFIATTSISGFHRANSGNFSYAQSKAACTLLIKQLSTALYATGIRVNGIAPGLYPSDMTDPSLHKKDYPKEEIPLQRTGYEEDMAGAVLYLTSRAGAYVSGNILVTDGGKLSITQTTY